MCLIHPVPVSEPLQDVGSYSVLVKLLAIM